MEEIDELRAKVIASMAAGGNPNSKLKRKSTAPREEGEVSSSDEELPTCSGVNATTNMLAGSVPPNLKSEQRKRLRSGVPPAKYSSSSLVDAPWKASTLKNDRKQIRRLPNKSYKRAWHRRSNSNDNLIISFTEGDDTETNSEESDLEITVKEKVYKDKIDGSKGLLRASNLQAEMLQHRPNSKMKELPAKAMISNLSGSSITKVQSAYPNISGTLGALIPEKEASIHRYDATNKVLQKQEVGHISDVNTTDDKMRSLRQQIAVRESELRLQKRSIPESQGRSAYLDASYHGNNMKPDAKAFRMDSPLGNILSSEESKDLKAADECPHSKVSSDGLAHVQLQTMKSVSETKMGALESSLHLEVVAGAHQLTKETALEKCNAKHGESNSDVHVSSGVFPLQMKDKEPLMIPNQVDGGPCQKRMSSLPMTSSLQDMKFINSSSHPKLTEQSSMDREVLHHVEELHDMELEEAQEIRRRCELEEMHALKAYRKAREALIAANSRCSFLYKRRELLSLFASRWLSRREIVPKTSDDLLSELNHLMHAEGQVLGQVGYECDTQNDPSHITSNLQIIGDILRENQCCKDDINVSNSDHMMTHSKQPNVIMDDEQEVSIDDGAVLCKAVHQNDDVNVGRRRVDIDVETEKAPGQRVRDFELEASLRSKLVARLGVKSATRNSAGTYNADGVNGSEMDAQNDQSNAYLSIVPSLSSQQFLEGEKITTGASNGNTCSPKDSSCPRESSCHNKIAVDPICSVLRIICKHFKLLFPESSSSNKEVIDVIFMTADRDKEHDVCSSSSATIGSRNGDLAIDPFWPLCMFELRGKCNDEECPWQHLKEHRRQKKKQMDSTSFSSDNQDDSSEDLIKINAVHRFPHAFECNIMSIPIYRIGSNLIKSDAQLSQSVMARTMWQYWQNSYCTSFPLPFSIQRILPPDAPILHAGDVHTTDSDNWARPSLYFSSKDRTMKQLKQCLSDPEQTVELAIDLFNQKNNNMDVERKALAILARAIEADPNSVALWIVYLQIYYGKEKQLGEDDMFSYAVKFNEGSYELWHSYINSRMHVDDRINAYDKALSVLCQWVQTPDIESKYMSACILDLTLQMIDFLCMSGDIDKAISRVYQLCSATDLGTSDHILFSDILLHLVLSDRCILWVCCIYVVIYRKLPEAVVQQFELEKDLPFVIEWPTTQLSTEENYRALELMEKAVDALALGDDNSLYAKDQSQGNLQRSAHFLAISHIKCVAGLDGLDSSVNLLGKYMRKYPTCVELLMFSARLQKILTQDAFIEGFERALDNWPKEIPGSQCLWNQYAEYALEYGRVDITKKLMEDWFHSFSEIKSLHCGETEAKVDDLYDSGDLQSSLLPAAFYSNKKDAVFGLLNLCLYKLLHKSVEEARFAVDKALDLATIEEFGHCVKEHVAFLFFSGSIPLGGRPHRAILDLLNFYLRDTRSCITREPLSRRFCRNIKKPKLRQLINSFLGPISLDFSLLNSVLEVVHGPSSIPEMFKEPKDLVDYVESLIAIVPANYQLVMSVYNFVVINCNSNAVAFKSIMFWVSCLLVDSIFQSFPVASEAVWLEAAAILSRLEIQGISEAFHQRAVSVYPFSLRLWRSYFNLSKKLGNANIVLEAAKRRGFELS